MIDLLTTGQAAKTLGLSRRRACRLAQEGRLGGVKIGRQWLFPRAAIDAFAALPREAGNPDWIARRAALTAERRKRSGAK